MDVERLDDLRELIGEYWCLAFAEGQEGRNTDTPDGAAQRCISAIGAIIREAQSALTPPEAWAEQHARDSRELRSLCAARDEARRERDIANNQLTRMRAALKKIAGYRLDQFSGPYDLASACIYDAENALPDDREVPDGRG